MFFGEWGASTPFQYLHVFTTTLWLKTPKVILRAGGDIKLLYMYQSVPFFNYNAMEIFLFVHQHLNQEARFKVISSTRESETNSSRYMLW